MVPLAGRLLLAAARAAVGPLALAAFFSDWTEGAGVLAGHAFSGFDLVAFTGRLGALDLTPWESALVWGLRLGVLGVAIAAAWQIVLVFGLRRHPAYAASGWYIALVAVLVVSVSVARDGFTPPRGGLLLAFAGATFVVSSRGAAPAETVPTPR